MHPIWLLDERNSHDLRDSLMSFKEALQVAVKEGNPLREPIEPIDPHSTGSSCSRFGGFCFNLWEPGTKRMAPLMAVRFSITKLL